MPGLEEATMSQGHEKRILWTATESSLPKDVWSRLEEMGCRVLLGRRDEQILGRIQQLTPRLWVEQVDGDPEETFSAVRTIRNEYPELPIILLSQKPNVEDAVKAIKMGVVDYYPQPVQGDVLWAGLSSALQYAAPRAVRTPVVAEEGTGPEDPIAVHPSMQRVFELAERISPSRSTLLIQGESGTGKEVIARHVHRKSGRKGLFVAVNCAALPENLLESELFGHERGAFTGAVARKKGKFELAGGGTMLLDEISEMPLSVQAKLLRVLQEREIDRVGGEFPIPVDTRVIATTNRDLEAETEKGNFRLDLFYRLNVIPILVPPLRERREDILPLANLFLKNHSRLNRLPRKKLSTDAEEHLVKRVWPGNVRELENLMERALLLVVGETIRRSDLEALSTRGTRAENRAAEPAGILPLREMEKRMINQALEEHRGNRTHAAEVLGISVRTLRNKLHEYRQELNGHEPASSPVV
jgi:two-component system response regulator FlrC